MGRLFDAVASLIGVRDSVSYEGQAAIELERLAVDLPPQETYPFTIEGAGNGEVSTVPMVIDTRPLIAAIAAEVAKGVDAALVARRFHSTIVEMIADVCKMVRNATGIGAAVLSGGVFLNTVVTREASARLASDGFRVYRHRLVPPGDGGLSLGQLAIAAACID